MKKNIFIAACFVAVFVIGIIFGTLVISTDKKENIDEKIVNIDIKYNKGKKYYIIKADYNGEYDYQEINLLEENKNYENVNDLIKIYNTTEVLSYNQYSEFCQKWNLKRKYSDQNKNYMVVSYASNRRPIVEARLANVIETDGLVELYLWENVDGVTADISAYFLAIPVSTKTHQSEINMAYTIDEYNDIINHNNNETEQVVKKPMLYIYPKKEMEVSVKLLKSSLITTSYPKYNAGWTIIANPDGMLRETETNRSYYGLYYEGKEHSVTMKSDGFIVKSEGTIDFLEEKLRILGLNEREANEFIVYWLPELEASRYNYIRFETEKEIDEYMPIEITPEPDSIIRIIMDYKSLNEPIKISEQKLTPKERYGYSVIEWGGSRIN